jgi:hypothetical protein
VIFELGEVGDEHRDQLCGLRVIGDRRPRSSADRGCAVDALNRTGTAKPKFGSVRNSALPSSPSSAAARSARVALIGMRLPVPYLPPVQPVLTSQQSTRRGGDQLRSRLPYSEGWRGMNGAPKQVENSVASGSVDALFGAGDLGGVAGEEVVHRLIRRQLGDRRHDAEGVGGQHDDRSSDAGRPVREAFGMKSSG